MSKTVIFGGTFNPPHLGHETLVRELCRREDVERLLLIPTKQPVHKVGNALASATHRLNMCKLLAETDPKADVWDIELFREEKSYTYLTVLDYRAKYGDTPWFLCGADMLVTLKTWYKYEASLDHQSQIVQNKKSKKHRAPQKRCPVDDTGL